MSQESHNPYPKISITWTVVYITVSIVLIKESPCCIEINTHPFTSLII